MHLISFGTGKIYTTGSYGHCSDLHLCDIKTGKWTKGCLRPPIGDHITMGVVQGKMFACGGGLAGNCELYDPEMDRRVEFTF